MSKPMTIRDRIRRFVLGETTYRWIEAYGGAPERLEGVNLPDGIEPGAMAVPGPSAEAEAEAEAKLALAIRAYEEVLDATKHQDDKVGRFLTAIAFLTTGAIALIAANDGLDLATGFDFGWGGDARPLLAWAAGAFFFCTIGAVSLLLLCLSVPVRLPSKKKSLDRSDRDRVGDSMAGSRIFYSFVAVEPLGEWRRRWEGYSAARVRAEIFHDYVRETHNLAERANAKYRHTFEASSMFVTGLLFLGVAIYLKLLALFANGEVVLRRPELMILAVIASAHALLQLYTRFVHDRRSVQVARNFDRARSDDLSLLPAGEVDKLKNDEMQHRQRRWTWTLLAAAPLFSFAMAIPEEDPARGRVGAAVLAVSATWLAMYMCRDRIGRPDDRWSWWWARACVGWLARTLKILSVPAVAVAAMAYGGVFQVGAVLAPAAGLGAMAVGRQFQIHSANQRKARYRLLPLEAPETA